jgi:hypothetical protein
MRDAATLWLQGGTTVSRRRPGRSHRDDPPAVGTHLPTANHFLAPPLSNRHRWRSNCLIFDSSAMIASNCASERSAPAASARRPTRARRKPSSPTARTRSASVLSVASQAMEPAGEQVEPEAWKALARGAADDDPAYRGAAVLHLVAADVVERFPGATTRARSHFGPGCRQVPWACLPCPGAITIHGGDA